MMSQRSRARAWFAVVAVVMLAVLAWLTMALVKLDEDERVARRDAALQERLRLALWRMDSWLAPQLARESLRPAKDYAAYPTTSNAWTTGYSKIQPGQVMVQSPLLGAESPLFRLHFEVANGALASPQSPTGNERDFAESNGISPEVLNRAQGQLQRLERGLPVDVLEQKVGGIVAGLPSLGCNINLRSNASREAVQTESQSSQLAVQTMQSVQELDNRQRNFLNNISTLPGDTNVAYANPGNWLAAAGESVGPMVPVWIDASDDEAQLVFARRVQVMGVTRLQAVLVDWPRLQAEMLGLIEDLFDAGDAQLIRCEQPSPEEQPTMLASVPARLVAEYRGAVAGANLPITTILWTTWGVTLLGLLVLGVTLRTAIGFGERRARFASAVTHELRTPLTTFRMYSEMLADGVVTEPAAQREYLRTLQRESDRLARVVENVLGWSRLEEGRFTARRERAVVGGLLSRVAPVLEQRLGEVDMELVVRSDDALCDAVVVTDEDAVGQVLFNLVDNAAKYAAGADDRRVLLTLSGDGERIVLTVCDHGPGVPAELRARVFVPFDRGAVRASSNDVPGVGLGLPLARGLARDLGGDLRLEAHSGEVGGACFVFELPRA